MQARKSRELKEMQEMWAWPAVLREFGDPVGTTPNDASRVKREQEAGFMGSVRLEIYRLELLRHPPFCPYCWMPNGRRMALKPTLAEVEALGCEVCGSAY